MAVENQASNKNGVATDLRGYLDEVWRSVPGFAENAAGLPADECGSFEWLMAVGDFWRAARERANMSREQAARALGCSVDRLRVIEFGLVSPRTLPSARWRDYARSLGQPELYTAYQQHFER